MKEPDAKFLTGDKMAVSYGLLIVECKYWVQWGENIWNVEIIDVKGTPNDDPALAALIVRALHATASGRLIITRAGKVLFGQTKAMSTNPLRVV